MNNKAAIFVTAAAVAIAVACLVLVLGYRSSESTVTRQLQQAQRALTQVELAQQQAARTAAQASGARLGVCYNTTTDESTFDLQTLNLASPVESGGVYQCPSGMTFVSVVPAAGS
jgi:type II secretory pathway pseudopilin PulG